MKLLSEYFDLKDAKRFQYLGLIIIIIAIFYSAFSGRNEFAIAIVSLGLGLLSLGIAISSEKRMKDMEKKEIQKKLTLFKEENTSNIKLLDALINRKNNYFPEDLLEKKLKQKSNEKYHFSLEEWARIQKGGLWLPKDNFSYDYALQTIELAHYFNNKFVNKIKKYISTGKELNIRKDVCQHWAVSRGIPNPDETKSYYNSIDITKESCENMKKSIENEIKRI